MNDNNKHIPNHIMEKSLDAVGAIHGALFHTGDNAPPELKPAKEALLEWFRQQDLKPNVGCQVMLELVGAVYENKGAPLEMLVEMARASAAHILAAALTARGYK